MKNKTGNTTVIFLLTLLCVIIIIGLFSLSQKFDTEKTKVYDDKSQPTLNYSFCNPINNITQINITQINMTEIRMNDSLFVELNQTMFIEINKLNEKIDRLDRKIDRLNKRISLSLENEEVEQINFDGDTIF